MLLLLSIAVFGCNRAELAQPNGPDSLTRSQTGALVNEISERYRRQYLLPQVGDRVAEVLLANHARGDYRHLRSETLASKLTTDLRAITGDIHARVAYLPDRSNGPGADVFPDALQASGLGRVERTHDNLGYIRVELFANPKSFAPAVDAAIASLTDTDALIIDVRGTPGGNSKSVAYLCSYFFERGERVLLNTFEYRSSPTQEEWTIPIPRPYLNRPVFVLTSRKTGSGAEGFAYQMQAFKRALIVGETTSGGAHTGEFKALEHGFALFVPTGRAVNGATRSNWERVGVKPDIESTADDALASATRHFQAQVR
jgi:retinol-binding protein 3